jgi:hypothetical protein
MVTKYTKRPENKPNCHKIYQHLALHDPPKFTQIGILGLKTFHHAALQTHVDATNLYLETRYIGW